LLKVTVAAFETVGLNIFAAAAALVKSL